MLHVFTNLIHTSGFGSEKMHSSQEHLQYNYLPFWILKRLLSYFAVAKYCQKLGKEILQTSSRTILWLHIL